MRTDPRCDARPARLPRRAVLVLGFSLLTDCARAKPDETPEGVVRAWIEAMQRVHGDPEDVKRAYALLAEPAKKNLEERARRASDATGRKMTPESMLVPSRFSLRFSPRTYRSRVAGDRALVEVTGADPEVEKAQVPCVREEGRWRVDLVLPPLPAIEKRPDGGV